MVAEQEPACTRCLSATVQKHLSAFDGDCSGILSLPHAGLSKQDEGLGEYMRGLR